MGTLKVGIREFREKLATYLLETDQTVAVTRHGDMVGYFIPARRKRTRQKEQRLKKSPRGCKRRWPGRESSEDEIVRDFKAWRRTERT